MHPDLAAIDQIYRHIEHDLFPSAEYLLRLTEDERKAQTMRCSAAQPSYNEAIERIRALLPQLTPDDMCCGYREGSRILQMNLSGHMGHHFVPQYLPVMYAALRAGHTHTARIFLYIVTEYDDEAMASLLSELLHHSEMWLRITTIQIIADRHFTNFRPQLQALLAENNPDITREVQRALEQFV